MALAARRTATDSTRTETASAQPHDVSQLAWLVSAIEGRKAGAYRYLLLLRFALVNLIGLAALAVAYLHGFVHQVVAADPTRLVVVIFLVFVVGLVLCARKVAQTSRELNQVKTFNPLVASRAAVYLADIRGRPGETRVLAASVLRFKLSYRIAVVRHVANSLVFLGLIGTVLGFIIALSGVDPSIAADASAITPMVATLIQGISVALYTTLVGAVLHLWLMVNYHMLASGTVNLITELVELGETHAGA